MMAVKFSYMCLAKHVDAVPSLHSHHYISLVLSDLWEKGESPPFL